MDADERHLLLWPPWAINNGLRYDQLSPASQEVWNKTRGIRTDAETFDKWVLALGDGIKRGLITTDEAEQAIRRVNGGT